MNNQEHKAWLEKEIRYYAAIDRWGELTPYQEKLYEQYLGDYWRLKGDKNEDFD